MTSKQRNDLCDGLVVLFGILVSVLFMYVITAPAEAVGWIKWWW